MNKDDDQSFDQSVKENGIREPITFNQHNLLLDGHSRYAKALKYYNIFTKEIEVLNKQVKNHLALIKENQIEKKQSLFQQELVNFKSRLAFLIEHIKLFETIPFRIKAFDDKLLEEKYVIECNLERRHLTNYQKIELGIPLLRIETKLAAIRKTATLKQNKPSGSNDPIGTTIKDGIVGTEKGKAVEIVAKKLGVSSTTMMRGKVVSEKAPEHLKEKLRKGKTSINSVYSHVTKPDRNLPKAVMPEGIFDVILCDVPIEFKNEGVRGAATKHYTTMSAHELSKLKVPSADNAIMFFWISTANQYTLVSDDDIDIYPLYQYILDAWDFKIIKGEFVWIKDRIGLGSWNRNQHEKCLIAIKGKMPTPAELFSSVIEAKREAHSKKPDVFYDMIEKMYPKRNYLELFARKKHNDNWKTFGNEVKQ